MTDLPADTVDDLAGHPALTTALNLGCERFALEVRAQSAILAELVRDAPADLAIPTCPEWTLVDLAEHVGRGQRWATGIIATRASGPVPLGRPWSLGNSPDSEAMAAWLLDGAQALARTVHAVGPGTPVWTWAADKTAGFWLRRMAHDLLIHRVDAELAVGRLTPVEPDLAADGVSDLLLSIATLSADAELGMFTALTDQAGTLHLHATDAGLGPAGEWLVGCGPDTVSWRHGHERAEVALRGRAMDLLLILNRRVPLAGTSAEVHGDRALLEHWLANSAF